MASRETERAVNLATVLRVDDNHKRLYHYNSWWSPLVRNENESLVQDTLKQRADVFHRWHRITLNELTSLRELKRDSFSEQLTTTDEDLVDVEESAKYPSRTLDGPNFRFTSSEA